MARSLSAGDTAKDGTDGESEAGQIATGEHIARHDLAGRVQVLHWAAVLHLDAGQLINRQASIGEGHPSAKRVGIERRLGYRHGPMALGWVQINGGAVVEYGRVE